MKVNSVKLFSLNQLHVDLTFMNKKVDFCDVEKFNETILNSQKEDDDHMSVSSLKITQVCSLNPSASASFVMNNAGNQVTEMIPSHTSKMLGGRLKIMDKKERIKSWTLTKVSTASRLIKRSRRIIRKVKLNKYKSQEERIRLLENELQKNDTIFSSQQQDISTLVEQLNDAFQIAENLEDRIKLLENDNKKTASDLQHAIHNSSYNRVLEESGSGILAMRVKNESRQSKKTMDMKSGRNNDAYSCEYCNMSFAKKCKLISHVRSHTNERPFSCKVCMSGFRYKDNLISHVLIVHCKIRRNDLKQRGSGQGFRCIICNNPFENRKACLLHIRQRHQNLLL